MVEADYSTHKSIVFAIREAITLYLFDKKREKDFPEVTEHFLSVDDYQGDRVPMSVVVKEVHAISNFIQDNYLGLKLNCLVNIEVLPFYKSISECIRPFSRANNELPFLLVSRLVYRFFFLITQSIELKLTAEKGLLGFELISNAADIMSKHQIDGAMVLVYRIIEAFCPGRLKKMTLAHRNNLYELEHYKTIFNVTVELDKKTSLIYELDCKNHYRDATTLLIKSEEELGRRFFINPLYNMLSNQFSELSYTQRCEIIIDTMMGVTSPTRDNVAECMNISVSTLQRKLNQEETSFQKILEDTRKRLAKLYLTEEKLSTTDVAHLLGYKSHSQFFRVFKIWFGMTPKTYRDNLTDCTVNNSKQCQFDISNTSMVTT